MGIGRRLADIVEEAADLIRPLWRAGLAVHTKADASPVTEADRRAETLILMRLSAAFPEIAIVSEEAASDTGVPEAIGSRFFLVDPLDGTKAFVRGDPNFTVNIGLVQDRRPIAGAVCAPALNETWWADESGAWKRNGSGGEPTAVAARRAPQGGGLALVSHTMKPEGLEALRAKHPFADHQPMDSSIKLCRIAEGAADLYARNGRTMEWDIAAGHALLEAAGGRLTAPDGAPFVYGKVQDGFANGPFLAQGAA